MKKNKAFTLAETLITLAVVGVVAAIVIPLIINNVYAYAWQKEDDNFKLKLNEAMNQMKTNEVLTGYATSADFVEKFKSYMKVGTTCSASSYTNCFVPTFMTASKQEITTSSLQTGADFGKTTYTSPLVGVQFNNGIQGIIGYNPSCAYVDPYDNRAVATTCLSMVYDLNGYAKPNVIGKDIYTYNATISTCDGTKIGALCVDSVDILPATFGYINTYAGSAADKAYDSACNTNTTNCTTNYWAAAKKYCNEQKNGMRLPTKDELNTIYIDACGAGSAYPSGCQNTTLRASKGFNAVNYWSSTDYNSTTSWYQYFATGQQSNYFKDNSQRWARCVK